MVAGSETILLTGAAGFLGTALARLSARCGLHVIGMDWVSPCDHSPFLSFFQTQHLENDLTRVLVEYRPTYLVHFAGNADVRRSFIEPRDDFNRSTGLFSAVLDQVRRSSPETRVLLASSAAVYGQPKFLPISESATPQPISPYGYHKWLCELLAREYTEIYGLKTSAMRIFSAYGAGLKKQILWDICCKCREGEGVELGGDGSETRDFVHADDVAAAALTILRKGDCAGEIYNVASGNETTIAFLASRLLTEFGVSTERLIFSGASRIGDPKNWRANVDLLVSHGFHPSMNLIRGITEYVQWFKKLH